PSHKGLSPTCVSHLIERAGRPLYLHDGVPAARDRFDQTVPHGPKPGERAEATDLLGYRLGGPDISDLERVAPALHASPGDDTAPDALREPRADASGQEPGAEPHALPGHARHAESDHAAGDG